MIRITSCLLVLAVLPIPAQTRRHLIPNAIVDQYRPVPLDQEKLGGIFADRIRAVREGYLKHTDVDALAANNSFDSLQRLGKFLQATAAMYDYSRDPDLRMLMDRVGKKLISIPFAADVCASREDLLGLLAYYHLTLDEGALAASKRIGDLILAKISASQAQILIEPLTDLARYTGNIAYSDFAKRAAQPLLNVGASIWPLDKGLPSLLGLLELYRMTGDNRYYALVISAWTTLRHDHFFLSFPARFLRVHEVPQLADPCDTALWIKLNLELLRTTGQSQYGAELERMVYNQLFAAEDARTGNAFSVVPLAGDKKPAAAGDPCTPSEAVGISAVPAAVWGRYGHGIVILQYTSGRATIRLRRRGTIQLYSETAYPSTGEILLHIEPGHPIQFPLRLRVPEWTSSFIVDIGQSHLVGQPGEFLTIAREWNRGDTVKIAMNMTVHMIKTDAQLSSDVAVQRGPQLFALSRILNPQIKDVNEAGPATANPAELELTPTDSGLLGWGGEQAYKMAGEYEGKRQTLILVPFADATNYCVFLRKPNAASGAAPSS